jgi:hypothetical protein
VHAAMFEVPKAAAADAASVRVNGAALAEILAGVERHRRRRPGRR